MTHCARLLPIARATVANTVRETKFGPPDDAMRGELEGWGDLAQPEALAVRIVSAGSWQELLGPQRPPRR
jgi:hypothetical protein